MPDLPNTSIGLIAFVIVIAGGLIYKIYRENAAANQKTVDTFMEYITKKNGIVERLADKFEKTLTDHDYRHKEMMDDMAARLEANLPKRV